MSYYFWAMYGCPPPPMVNLYLTSYNNKILALKSIRQVTGCNLQDAMVVLNSLPYCIFGPIEEYDPELKDRKATFESNGWAVELRPA
jgi:ribosomal protein L7/L12